MEKAADWEKVTERTTGLVQEDTVFCLAILKGTHINDSLIMTHEPSHFEKISALPCIALRTYHKQVKL